MDLEVRFGRVTRIGTYCYKADWTQAPGRPVSTIHVCAVLLGRTSPGYVWIVCVDLRQSEGSAFRAADWIQ